MVIYFSILISAIASCRCLSLCNSTFVSRSIGGMQQESVSSEGDYMIQVMIALTIDEQCVEIGGHGMQLLFGTRYIIERLNNDANLLPFSKLGYRIDDVCFKLPFAMKRGLDIASHYRPNSVCRAEFGICRATKSPKTISAVVGTARSSSTIPLASLLSLYDVPHMSYSASSRLLSDKRQYKSFFRTMPSDKGQAMAMLDILTHFGWNYVFAVGSDDDYGKFGITELKKLSFARNVCIAREEYIAYNTDSTRSDASHIVDLIKSYPKAKVVILFIFPEGQGEAILNEADRLGVQRIWLTSEAWHPSAASLKVSNAQLQGLLTVALPAYEMPALRAYVLQSVLIDWQCDTWLRRYVLQTFLCNIRGLHNNTFHGTRCDVNHGCNVCNVSVENVLESILNPPRYSVSNLMDAVEALAMAIDKAHKMTCAGKSSGVLHCGLDPELITSLLFNVSFANQHNQTIEFDSSGDPRYVSYSLQNMQVKDDSGKRYVAVGHWKLTQDNGSILTIREDLLQWPWWTKSCPESICSLKCQPGWYVVGKSTCCWGCQRCPTNSISQSFMADNCTACSPNQDYYTNDQQTECLLYTILFVKPGHSIGIAVIAVSLVGEICIVACFAILLRYRHRDAVNKSNPQLLFVLLIGTMISFGYGVSHVFRPNEFLCKLQIAYFLMMLTVFSSILLVKTKFFVDQMERRSVQVFFGQISVTLLLLGAELLVTGIWANTQRETTVLTHGQSKGEKWLECPANPDPLKLVTIGIPCFILLMATYTAIKERNIQHPLYEPKFVSFTSTALCIMLSAFLPTYRYVVGIYKALVATFVVDLSLFLVLACLVAPTLYAAIIDKDMSPPPELEMSFGNSIHTGASLKVKDDKRSLRAAELSVSSVTLVAGMNSPEYNTQVENASA